MDFLKGSQESRGHSENWCSGTFAKYWNELHAWKKTHLWANHPRILELCEQRENSKSFQSSKTGLVEPGLWIRMILDFSVVALGFIRQQRAPWILRENNFQPRILYPLTTSAKGEGENILKQEESQKIYHLLPLLRKLLGGRISQRRGYTLMVPKKQSIQHKS